MFTGALEPHSATAGGALIKELNTGQLKRVNQVSQRPLMGFPRPALDEDFREELEAYFAEDVALLDTLTGRPSAAVAVQVTPVPTLRPGFAGRLECRVVV